MSISFHIGDSNWDNTINFSNTNACALMGILNIPVEPCGSIPHEALPGLRRAILKALHSSSARVLAIREGSEGRGEGGCRWIDMGNTDESTIMRLEALQRLVVLAQEKGVDLLWD